MNPGRAWHWAASRSPFLWLIVTPVLTLPVSALLVYQFGGEHDAAALGVPPGELCHLGGAAKRCFEYYDFWRMVAVFAIPGAVNAVVALWLLSRHSYVRVAAITAMLVAVLRVLVVPFAAMAMSQFETFTSDGLYFRVEVGTDQRATLQLLLAAWAGGLVAWGLTLVAWYIFEPVMARLRPQILPPGRRRTAPGPSRPSR